MSLDVYLEIRGDPVPRAGTGVFIREDGATRELTAEEVASKWPDAEVSVQQYEVNEVYWRNITHNLNKMADEAGIYKHLWHPGEVGITTAGQLIEPLAAGLELLRSDPERFKKFNPDNGWGKYEGLVEFVADYLNACREYPDATVRASA